MPDIDATIVLRARDEASRTLKVLGGSLLGVGMALSRLAEDASKVDDLRQAFDALAKGAGQDANEIIAAMQNASRGTVSNVDLIRQANETFLTSGETVAKELPRLMEIAYQQANATGRSTEAVFSALTTGIARTSPRMLYQAGIVLDMTEVNRKYAESIGKAADKLTEEEQQQAMLNAVLAKGAENLERVGDLSGGLDEQMDQARAGMANFGDAVGRTIAPLIQMSGVGMPVAAMLSSTTQLLGQAKSGMVVAAAFLGDKLIPSFQGLGLAIKNSNLVIEAQIVLMELQEKQAWRTAAAIAAWAAPFLVLAGVAAAFGVAAYKVNQILAKQTEAVQENAKVMATGAKTYDEYVDKLGEWRFGAQWAEVRASHLNEALEELRTQGLLKSREEWEALPKPIEQSTAAIEGQTLAMQASTEALAIHTMTQAELATAADKIRTAREAATKAEKDAITIYEESTEASQRRADADLKGATATAGVVETEEERQQAIITSRKLTEEATRAEYEHAMELAQYASAIQKTIDAEEDWGWSTEQVMAVREEAILRATDVVREAMDAEIVLADRVRGAWAESSRDFIGAMQSRESEMERHINALEGIADASVDALDIGSILEKSKKREADIIKDWDKRILKEEKQLQYSRTDAAWRERAERIQEMKGEKEEALQELRDQTKESVAEEEKGYAQRAGAAATARANRFAAEAEEHAKNLARIEKEQRETTLKMVLAQAERDGALGKLGFPDWVKSADQAYAGIMAGQLLMGEGLMTKIAPAQDMVNKKLAEMNLNQETNNLLLEKAAKLQGARVGPAVDLTTRYLENQGDAAKYSIDIVETGYPRAFDTAKTAGEEMFDKLELAAKGASPKVKEQLDLALAPLNKENMSETVRVAMEELAKLLKVQPIVVPIVWSYPPPTGSPPPPNGTGGQGAATGMTVPMGPPRTVRVHAGETIVPAGQSMGGPTLIIQGNVYGMTGLKQAFEDFWREKDRAAAWNFAARPRRG